MVATYNFGSVYIITKLYMKFDLFFLFYLFKIDIHVYLVSFLPKFRFSFKVFHT